MNANVAPAEGRPVIRSEPDTSRPAVSTTVAATRFRLSRFYVSELVRRGKIEGYGVRRHERGRTRWYVYADALPDEPDSNDRVLAAGYEQQLLKHLLDARKHSRLARNERGCAQRQLVDVLDGMTAALRAAGEGDKGRAFELLLAAQETRNDEERRLVMAQQHEADAEACLDAALQSLLPSGEEVKPQTRGDSKVTSSMESTAPRH